jgi:hypothetical protein
MGEGGSPVLDIVEQVIRDFEHTLAHNVLVRSVGQHISIYHRGIVRESPRTGSLLNTKLERLEPLWQLVDHLVFAPAHFCFG